MSNEAPKTEVKWWDKRHSSPLNFKMLMYYLLGGFFAMLFIADLFWFYGARHYGQWDLRRMKESASVEMHGEDIWRNQRSTLKVFDPLACKTAYFNEWRGTWYEVTCDAEDFSGQKWTYTVRYGVRASYLVSWLPFVRDTRPAREMNRIEEKPAAQGGLPL